MENFTLSSKFVPETISIVVSFLDLLSKGDTISGLPTITISVYSGVDNAPEELLYLGPSVTNGVLVEQRIRLGISGVIYIITFTVNSLAGDTFSKECYLAVLAEEGGAIPTWLPLTLTTQLYPIIQIDSYKSSSSIVSGNIQEIVIYYSSTDNYKSTPTILSGTLQEITITYTTTESYKSTTTITSGTLVVIVVSYSLVENYKANTTILSGTLVVIVVPYSTSDSYKATTTITAGTLT